MFSLELGTICLFKLSHNQLLHIHVCVRSELVRWAEMHMEIETQLTHPMSSGSEYVFS